MTVLYQSEHAVLEVDHSRRLMRFTRSAVPFASPEQAADTFRAVGASGRTVDRARYVLLSDVRNAPGRNDPAFESTITKYSHELFGGFARRATLVRTATGALQVQRLNRDRHTDDMRVFHDEAEALAFLGAR